MANDPLARILAIGCATILIRALQESGDNCSIEQAAFQPSELSAKG